MRWKASRKGNEMSDLLKINVNDHTEKKNNLTYLSWAWAWAEVLKVDPQATWQAFEYGPQGAEVPYMQLPDGSCMVRVGVTIKGHHKTCLLPVMNHRNQAIKGPDAFAVNTAIMRCLAKAISMHGLGLYIYAGEDLPEEDSVKQIAPTKHSPVPEVEVDTETKERLEEITTDIVIAFEEGRELDCIELYYHQITDNDEKIYVWKLLAPHTKLRSFLKVNKPQAVTA
jgi:hypothetical protein